MIDDSDSSGSATRAQLLAALREATGESDLNFAGTPAALSGGFYAEMLRFRLAESVDGLEGELVARIVPDPDAGAWEATVQRNIAELGFPTPRIRLTAEASNPLGRYLIVMDHAEGHPPMAGLTFGSLAGQIPALLRHLPDQLARTAAELHALDPEPLATQLEALPGGIPTTTEGFVLQQCDQARRRDRPRLAEAGERLLETPPVSTVRVVTHGDLHPFNLLVTPTGPILIDWTVARIAHPAFTLGFTDLMLANPPIPLPRAGRLAVSPIVRSISKRFLTTYRALTAGTFAAVDDVELHWYRNVHALRILVEIAGWDSGSGRPRGHPWLLLEPVARRMLDLPPQ